MTNNKMPQFSKDFNQSLTKILADFFQEESMPEEVSQAVEIDIEININMSKLSELQGQEASLVAGEKRVTVSSENQSMQVLRTTCKPCKNPGNDICGSLGKYCQR